MYVWGCGHPASSSLQLACHRLSLQAVLQHLPEALLGVQHFVDMAKNVAMIASVNLASSVLKFEIDEHSATGWWVLCSNGADVVCPRVCHPGQQRQRGVPRPWHQLVHPRVRVSFVLADVERPCIPLGRVLWYASNSILAHAISHKNKKHTERYCWDGSRCRAAVCTYGSRHL